MTKGASRQGRWFAIVVRALLVLIASGLILFGVAAGLVWWIFRDGHKITVTVVNATTQPIRSIAVLDGPSPSNGNSLARLPDAESGKKAQITIHFKRDIGPAWLFAKRSDTDISLALHFLLTDKGPYDYTVVVKDKALHVERYARSKGSSTDDYPLDAGSAKR